MFQSHKKESVTSLYLEINEVGCDGFFFVRLKHMPTEMLYIKFINASQARIYRFKNLKKKLYNCNANIFFKAQNL
jgi:hypothetical protein